MSKPINELDKNVIPIIHDLPTVIPVCEVRAIPESSSFLPQIIKDSSIRPTLRFAQNRMT